MTPSATDRTAALDPAEESPRFTAAKPFLWLRAVTRWEASTRSLAVLRIGLGLLFWAEYCRVLSPFRTPDPRLAILGPIALVAAGTFAAGWFTRASGAVLGTLFLIFFFYFGLELGMTKAFVHHHSYLLLVAILLVALGPSSRSLSFDRWRARRRGASSPERGPQWTLGLLRYQVALMYFWAAVNKTHWAFLSGSRLSQMFAKSFGDSDGLPVPYSDELAAIGGTGTVLLEYALAFGLWFAGPRRILVPLGILFHAAIHLSFPVGTFSVTTCLLYLAFYPPDEVHRNIDELLGSAGPLPRRAQVSSPEA
ncbi:MAG TPA: HTTM domain-containing protein [Polyangiaceae bacterium LLY-WYZ-14_1]|nr:HTTM domain-containing protein [Polyangiaceae bacterium LLY-WYZ-14_1]